MLDFGLAHTRDGVDPSKPRGRPLAGLPIRTAVAQEQKATRENLYENSEPRAGLSNLRSSTGDLVAGSYQRIHPLHPPKPREIAIARIDRQPVLDCQSCQIGILNQIAGYAPSFQ